MPKHLIARLAAGFAVLACAGCGFLDPYERVGVWHPRNANEGNLAAMVVDPHDLQVGKSSTTTDALMAAAAVDRLRHDKVKPLLNGSFDAAPSSSGAAATGGGVGDGIN
jgi:hypothetical protein